MGKTSFENIVGFFDEAQKFMRNLQKIGGKAGFYSSLSNYLGKKDPTVVESYGDLRLVGNDIKEKLRVNLDNVLADIDYDDADPVAAVMDQVCYAMDVIAGAAGVGSFSQADMALANLTLVGHLTEKYQIEVDKAQPDEDLMEEIERDVGQLLMCVYQFALMPAIIASQVASSTPSDEKAAKAESEKMEKSMLEMFRNIGKEYSTPIDISIAKKVPDNSTLPVFEGHRRLPYDATKIMDKLKKAWIWYSTVYMPYYKDVTESQKKSRAKRKRA